MLNLNKLVKGGFSGGLDLKGFFRRTIESFGHGNRFVNKRLLGHRHIWDDFNRENNLLELIFFFNC